MEKILGDPVLFCKAFFNFNPTDYQARLLRDTSKRIVVRWSRQAGKTTTLALRAIWYAVTHPKTLTLIVAPSLRQSMIMSDRIGDFLGSLPKKYFNLFVKKLQRTVVTFRNNSRIVALPNSPQLLRGYTAHVCILDEAAFFRDDELVIYNVIMPMLSTTDGTLIVSSTPWSTDSVFYRMCMNPEYSQHVITWEDVVKAGLVKPEFIEEMRQSIPAERFQREFESKFVEDVDAWLPQSLIASCIDSELQPYDFHDNPQGDFYVGVDFGKQQDYSVVVVVQKFGNILKLVHVHRFPLNTEYASVIGYVKSLQDRWKTVHSVYADITGVGAYIVEDMVHSGIQNVQGITFTIQTKEDMATVLREKMRQREFLIPYEPVRKRQDIDLCTELNIEKYELMKTGHIRFSHPEGCYSADTRVFTDKGLKRFNELTEDDKILTLNPQTLTIQFEKPLRVFEYDYSGPLYHFSARSIDFLVTPNHNMLVKYIDNHRDRKTKPQFKFRKADEVAKLSLDNVVVPTTGKWIGKDEEFFTLPTVKLETHKKSLVSKIPIELWLKFFGFWLAEGSVHEKQRRVVIRNLDRKKLDDLKEVVEQMGFRPYIDYKRGQMFIASKQLCAYLKQFGHAKDKFIPEWIKNLPPARLSTLLLWMFKGDGTIHNGKIKAYHTGSWRLANDVIEIALKCGYGVGIRESRGGFKNTKMFKILLRKQKENALMKVEKQYYSGKVWCVEVPSHVILVERNGKIAFCGNSHDDVFWATALAVYGAVQTPLPGKGAFIIPH